MSENQSWDPMANRKYRSTKSCFSNMSPTPIKSGALNLKHSFKNRPFEHYLISKDKWERNKDELMERAGLKGFENFAELIPELRKAINNQFAVTNQNIQTGKNKHAKIDKRGNLIVSTPKIEKPENDPVAELFPKDRVVSVFEVLKIRHKDPYRSSRQPHSGFKRLLYFWA